MLESPAPSTSVKQWMLQPAVETELSMLFFVPLLRNERRRKCTNVQDSSPSDGWHLPSALSLVPSPPPPSTNGVIPRAQQSPWTHREHAQEIVRLKNLTGTNHIFSICTLWVHFNAPKITAAHFSQPKPCSQIWRALHPVQCFPLISWDWKTMLKHCELSYMIFEHFVLQTLREWV